MDRRNLLTALLAGNIAGSAMGDSVPPPLIKDANFAGALPRLSEIAKHGLPNYGPVINRAIAQHGGVIIDFTDVVPVDNISVGSGSSLIGLGSNKTIIRRVRGATGAVISNSSPDSERVFISGITVDGAITGPDDTDKCIGLALDNSASGAQFAKSSVFRHQDPRCKLDDIFIMNCSTGLVHTGKGCSFFSNIWIYKVLGNGLELNSFDSVWSSIDVGACGKSGIYLGPGCANNRFTNIKAWYTGLRASEGESAGVHMEGAFRNNFSCVEIQNCANFGLLMIEANFNNFSSISVEGPSPDKKSSFTGAKLVDVSFANLQAMISERGDTTSLKEGIVFAKAKRGCTGIAGTVGIANQQGKAVALLGGQSAERISLIVNGGSLKD